MPTHDQDLKRFDHWFYNRNHRSFLTASLGLVLPEIIAYVRTKGLDDADAFDLRESIGFAIDNR